MRFIKIPTFLADGEIFTYTKIRKELHSEAVSKLFGFLRVGYAFPVVEEELRSLVKEIK